MDDDTIICYLEKSQELSFWKEQFLRLRVTQKALQLLLSNILELFAFVATDHV